MTKTTITITVKRGNEEKTYALTELGESKGGKLKFQVMPSVDFPDSEGRFNILYVNPSRKASNVKARK